MSIIMVDYEDAFIRADKFAEMSKKCADFSKSLNGEYANLSQKLKELSDDFNALSCDIRKGAGVWEEFYRTNIRL